MSRLAVKLPAKSDVQVRRCFHLAVMAREANSIYGGFLGNILI
ncbi:MAG: hypothetical protein ACRC24_06265 [Vibrionaceae bacterium]